MEIVSAGGMYTVTVTDLGNGCTEAACNPMIADAYEGNEMADGDVDTFRALMERAVDEQAAIDQMTDRALVAKWPIGRIDPTLRGLFRAAGAEFLLGTTPPKVIIVEFVSVAQAFFPEGKEPKFVNAVLDHMAREAQPDQFQASR